MHRPNRQKIKRYRRSFTNKAERSLVVRRVISFLILLAALFGVGWLVAEPAIDLASGLWYSIKSAFSGKGASSSSQPITSSSPPQSESTPESRPTPQPVKELQNADGNWAYVAFSAIDTVDKAEETAQNLAAQGVKCAIMQLKDERGYLYYPSNIALAKQQIAERTLDSAQIAKTFTDNGIVPIASIYAFKDGLASRQDRSAAVTYNGQEGFLWLDNQAELGGSSWLTPYSPIAKQYISDIISELLGFGFKQIIVSGAYYPDGYGLSTAVFAPSGDTRTLQAALADCVQAWQAIATNANAQLWIEYPIEAVLDDSNKKTYGSPVELGINNLLIDFSQSVQSGDDGSTLDHSLFAAAAAKAAQGRVAQPKLAMSIGSGLLEPSASYLAASGAKSAGFVSFVVQ